jgi:hypothetical protein
MISNLVTGRQLRAARALAGLTQQGDLVLRLFESKPA